MKMSVKRAMQVGMYCPVCNVWMMMSIFPPVGEHDWEPYLDPRDCQSCGAKFMFDYAPASMNFEHINVYNLDIPKPFYENFRSMFGRARFYPIAIISKEKMPNVRANV